MLSPFFALDVLKDFGYEILKNYAQFPKITTIIQAEWEVYNRAKISKKNY